MADLSKITLPNGSTYDLKDLQAAASIESTGGNGVRLKKRDGTSYSASSKINTQDLERPTGLRGLNDVTLQSLVSTARANRLAFLPADQIIIEQTVDGGTIWTDAGIGDATKLALFSETRPTVNLPVIGGKADIRCGLRITFTAMKYDVPDGTAETEKYNYWNSNYVLSAERYCQLKEMYFWLGGQDGSISIVVQRARGSTSTTWDTIFNDSSFYMTGWSGCDYIRFPQWTFGGGTNQTTQPWNYRLILMTRGVSGTDTYGSSRTRQAIYEIRGYGDSVWISPNRYMMDDHMYTKDVNKNVTFPANVTATNFVGKVNGHTVSADVPSDLATQLSNRYTKSEVDALVSSVFHYKGTKTTYAEVQALIGMKTGDVWQVTADNSEYVYNGSAWEKLGPTIDLSGYLTSVSVAGHTLTPTANSITVAQLKTALGLKSAAYVDTETAVANDAKLPTGAAVKTFVEGKGYTTNTGTVTKVSTGVGLTGGDVTTTGTIKAKLKSETASSLDSAAMGSTASRQYAVGVDKSGYLSTNVPWVDTHPFGTYDVLASKTYTGVIAEGTTQALSNYYALKILPTNYNNSWTLVYRVTATIAGVSEANGSGFQESYVYIYGMRDTYALYRVVNNIRHTSYRPIYYHTLYRAKAAGITNKYGHIMGVGLRSSWNPTTAANSRTITFEILQAEDCTVSFLNSMVLYEDAPGTGSTNYSGLSEFNGSAQGDTHSGDANSNNYDRLAITQSVVTAGSAITATSIIVANTNGTYKNLKSGTAFDITYPILYSTAAIAANAKSTANASGVYVSQYFAIKNTQNMTLTFPDPVYIKGNLSGTIFTPISTTPLVQDLPSSADGYEYIYLGMAYAATSMFLYPEHPIFAFRNGHWGEIVTGSDEVNGHIVGHDENENVVVAWDGGEVVTPPASTALAISQGGTGATTAAAARTNLGLGSAATYNVVSSVNNDSNLVTGAAIKAYYEAVGIPSAISTTSAATAAKVATCSSYSLLANSYIQVILANANTASSTLTLNINGKGAKTIFINGTVSSSSNKTLPAGSYFVFYNGTNYYFRTDGKITADITGNAETATNASKVNDHTVEKDVPDDAVFTDTTELSSMSGILGINHGGTGAATASEARNKLGLQSLLATELSSSANITIGPTGYATLTSSGFPIPTKSGYTFLFSYIKTWSNMSPIGAFSISGDGTYLIGAPNTTINGLRIAYVFMKNL